MVEAPQLTVAQNRLILESAVVESVAQNDSLRIPQLLNAPPTSEPIKQKLRFGDRIFMVKNAILLEDLFKFPLIINSKQLARQIAPENS